MTTRVEIAKKRRACADDVAAGMPMAQIMEKYGWHQDTVRKVAHQYGVCVTNDGMKGNMERVFVILGRIRAGADADELVDELGISRSYVSKIKSKAIQHGVLDPDEVEENFEATEIARIEAKWRRENPGRPQKS